MLKIAFDKRIFLKLFPNLRVFIFDSVASSDLNQDFFDEPFRHLLPDTKLERVEDGGMCEFTRQLTLSGTCTRLQQLSLKISAYLENSGQDIFPYLKNMPVLKKLAITYGKIRIQDCEFLHSNLPSLEELDLEDVTVDAGLLPRDIIPATSITTYSLQFEDDLDFIDYPDWYIYIAKKYTNLEYFFCYDPLIREASHSQTMKIYRDGILPLYRNIGKCLRSFGAKSVPTELEIFSQLDDIGCQFSLCRLEDNDTRPIFSQLAHSKQAKYVEQLELENTMVTSPSLPRNMTRLVSINIDMNGFGAHWPINLTEYMNAFPPTLIDFSVTGTHLEISEIPTLSNNIQELFIGCLSLTQELAQVVSTCFPRLNSMYLKGHVEENMTIDMPTHHFKRLVIETYFRKEPTGFSLVTTSDSQVKYYLGQTQQASDYSTVKPATPKELQDKATIKIICASTNDPSFHTKDSLYLD